MLKYVRFKFAGLCDGPASCHDFAAWLHKGIIRGDGPFEMIKN